MTNASDETKMGWVLQTADTDLLVKVASGEIDIQKLIAQEMKNRGLDVDGKWVGFERAAELWGKI